MMASSAQPMSDPYQALKVTGEWNSKTTEDYIEMCKTEITGSEEMQQDLAYMAGQWRDTVVQEIGRARYNELSEQLGCDLAYAYMDHRIEELMIDRLVKERMPKSSADYIIRKAAESSLLGLSQTLSRSPLTDEIEARGEAAYRQNIQRHPICPFHEAQISAGVKSAGIGSAISQLAICAPRIPNTIVS